MARKGHPRDDFDGPWKDVLERFFHEFIEFCAEDVSQAIDWSEEVVFLQQELAALVPEEDGRKGIVDVLAQVRLKGGAAARVLCHVEAQARRTDDLGRRLFRDHTRLFESKQLPIFTLAPLLDRSPTWRPDRFDNRVFGTGSDFRFRSVKLRDWLGREAELLASPNPFAQVVLTWLELQRARTGAQRLESKGRLIRGLLTRGLEAEKVRGLLRFIGWIVRLPAKLETRFIQEMRAMTELKDDVYMLPWERDGWERGMKEGMKEGGARKCRENVLRFLAARFGHLPEEIRQGVERIGDPDRLDRLVEAAAVAENLADFAAALAEKV
ncbi:MAG: hypothetical protein HY812_17665 [Planctomycetes bacterium]|nr:hypothetical protein [Planctomycetota bacterium]